MVVNIREPMPSRADVEALRREIARLQDLVGSKVATNEAATFLLLDTLVDRKALRYVDIGEAVRQLCATIPDYLRGPDLDRFLASVRRTCEEREAACRPRRAWTPAVVPGERQDAPANSPE